MKSFTLKAFAVIACLALSQTAFARQVAVCNAESGSALPNTIIRCMIGESETPKKTTLFEMTKAGWSIQAVTPIRPYSTSDNYYLYIYLEKP